MLRTVARQKSFDDIWLDKGAEGKELWRSLLKMRGEKKLPHTGFFGSHRLFFQNLKLPMSPVPLIG